MDGLRKIEVTRGITWIEVPEAGLRLLCGCPADAVKHLMRRGLILPTEVGGVACETGPNAILLSDVMVQNGAFCNLTEFPVLQMFYRQGMLLPGHPNNTGLKPLLIGRREQIEAQIQYIYRGNYGLISEEELRETGLPEDEARQLMRLKLRFAFGRIQHPGEMIDTLALEDEAVEIRPGVMLRRLALNKFEVYYWGASVTIDLNLPPFEVYESPYTLGFHQIPREYFAVIHSGDGDGWDFRRPSMGAVLVYQGRIFLVDAGPNLVFALGALGIGVNEIEGIFHTHSHDDHFAGLTTLVRADRRIKYFAAPMVRAAVARKLAALLAIEEADFNGYFDVRDLTVGTWNDIDGLEVKPVFSPHPVETTIFFFRVLAEGGWRTYAHFADIVTLATLDGMVVDDPAAPGLSRARYQRVVEDYAELADVKKVDIGGGLIHGCAEDFAADGSGKIILAHTARTLTDAEKQIGSGASFGTVDVLVRSYRDFARRGAFQYLSGYFPGVPAAQLEILVNTPVVTFNPETIVLKEGTTNEHIFLVLTGEVEMLGGESGARGILSAGALIGELTGLHGGPALRTYRAANYVQALRISAALYREFVKRHDLLADILGLLERREFLRRTWLFGDVVWIDILNRIANDMRTLCFQAGDNVEAPNGTIGVLVGGSAVRLVGGRQVERLVVGDFLGEERAVFDDSPLGQVIAFDATDLYLVPAATLAGSPGIRWKLFETFHRRARAVATLHRNPPGELVWRDEYAVNVQRLDNHHRRLFDFANRVLTAVRLDRGPADTVAAVHFLLAHARSHFDDEEALLAQYGYGDGPGHADQHRHLLDQLGELERHVVEGGHHIDEMQAFIEAWIVRHILVDDRRACAFLNGKGVY